MRKYTYVTVSITLLGIMLTLVKPSTPAVAQEDRAILRFGPSAMGLVPGTQGTLDILVDNAQNLYGLEFQLSFDPEIIEVIDADSGEAGVQILPADWWKDGFVAVNLVDNENGRIDFAATLLNPAPPAIGNRLAATITLVARQNGASRMNVESAILSTRNAEILPYTKQEGEIGVNPSGQAPELQADIRSVGLAPGRLMLAGTAILTFILALTGFIYVLRRSR